jgi:hypothetical protein
MSSRTLAQHVPNREAVEDRLSGARFQIETMNQQLAKEGSSQPQLESCLNAAIDQLIQAINATLAGFNSMLPDPLPAQRISRRNLRDQFYAVGAESNVLQIVDNAARSGDGWLWYLEQKHDGAAYSHLLLKQDAGGSSTYAVVRDPLNSKAGTEQGSPESYLNAAYDQVLQLLDEIARNVDDDVMIYREAQRRQARRLI